MHIDPFAVFLALACTAGGAVIAAIAADGWKARLLWVLGALFAAASIGFWFRPASITDGQIWNYFLAVMPLTVVVLVLASRSPPALPKTLRTGPATAREPRIAHNSEEPDMKLAGALTQITQSIWAESNKATPEAILVEFRDKLATHKLTAFGRREAGAVIEPIPPKSWHGLFVSSGKRAAVTEAGQIVYHDLQFDSAFVARIWPTSLSWMRI